eukprot:TRINITY_DN9203_c0_g1_i1.p1 TRINITY_DN9203_c0_g1~~TRINITY_DN9203_c0_g1_i1.p1  ORF type:complete len:510 (+),score=150.29 TRINITY_DN9203_c0_g1_i1:35-1531(+)
MAIAVGGGGAGDAWGRGEDRFRSPSRGSGRRSREGSRGPASRGSAGAGGLDAQYAAAPLQLPPLPRPPSAEEVETARRHLALLKAKRPSIARGSAQPRERSAAQPRERSAVPAARRRAQSPGGEYADGRLQRTHSVPPRPAPDGSGAGIAAAAAAAAAASGASAHAMGSGSPPVGRVPSGFGGHSPLGGGGGNFGAPPASGIPSGFGGHSPVGGRAAAGDAFGAPPAGGIPSGFGGNSPVGGSSARQGYAFAAPPVHDQLSPQNAFGGAPPPPPEAMGDEGELIKCDDCGRSFNPESIEKHRRICKKVFMQKRKKFDSAANRLGDHENAGELISKAKQIESEVKAKEAKAGAPGNENAAPTREKPMPAWKKKSLEFRAAMLAEQASKGDAVAKAKADELQKELGSAAAAAGAAAAPDPDKTTCPHCGRSFNNAAAERHIAICVKMFGGKPGGGRLVRGGGMNCNANSKPTGAAAGGRASQAGAPRSAAVGAASARRGR